ncbi:acyltransferase family protein [Nitrincola sp. A-D6]|uniref:acyltransferase family protein n=1 Tax=Nitrincola sp. A-D6 TaxID=1545442 RepID=UPI000B2E5664|nr:acyltransferase family protein [Nitrincola sp. A-D6]
MSSLYYRPDIQGLRAIAVLAVIGFHFNPAWLPGGFIGVDVFLVISGFLITSILLQKKTQADYSLLKTLKYFYSSRFKRIVPAYFVMLVVVALVAAIFFLPQDFNTFKKGLEKAAWFNSNTYFADFGDYFAPANHEQPLLHTWSLAVEIQFYIIAPFIVLLLSDRWLKWVFASLLFGLTAIAEYRLRVMGVEQATYYSLYARMPEFLAGGLAALFVRKISEGNKGGLWIGKLGLVLIILSTITQPLLGPFPGIAAMLPVVGSVLLISQPAQGWVGILLSSRILVWIGALSYSLYLWHWPVLAFLRYSTGVEVLSFGISFMFILLTLLLSIISYYSVERAFRSRRTSKKQAVGVLFLAASVLGTSQVMAKVNLVFTPEQLPIEYRRYADPATICHGQIVGDCMRGDLSSDKEILVLGDSHAAMLNHYFDYLGNNLGFKARIITASSCVTITDFDYHKLPEWAQQSCLNQIEEAKVYIQDADVILIAGMWSYQLENEEFKIRMNSFFENSNTKVKIYIASQIAMFDSNPSRLRRFNDIGFNAKSKIDLEYVDANRQLEEMASLYDNVEYIPLNDIDFFSTIPLYKGSGCIVIDIMLMK